ncbi:MAG: response regulator transcription factor [Microbacteriaceae bacterium]|nr:MAG: response regulator transcription factor [Microbacteriaceae bacterium]
MTIRVVLADDQALIREGFRAILERSDDIRVVGEASDGVDAVAVVQRTRPDVAIMDVRMPRLDGIEATARLSRDGALADTRVLVVTTYEIDENVFAALRAGASGFLLKDLEPEDLRRAVRVVAGGDSLLAPSVTRRLIAQFVAAPHRSAERDTQLELLTGREREIVTLVGEGLSNTEIGQRLYISPATAKTHVSRAMVKLELRDRAQLVVFAYESGLATAPGP